MSAKSELSKVLRALASAVEALSDKEVEALVTGKGKLRFVPNEKPKESVAGTKPLHEDILRQLQGCQDRTEAKKILDAIKGRDELASLAKSQKLYVAKHDRREDIENKIIEFLIGAKLRTEAIRSLNLRGGNE